VTSPADLTALRTLSAAVEAEAVAEFEAFWRTLDLSKPDKARDALLAYLPAVASTFGDADAAVVADWYEQTRAVQIPGGYRTTLAPAVDESAVAASVRFAAGHLFTDDPGGTRDYLTGATQRFVANAGRDTIITNVARDPARPKYARIPAGVRTCGYCAVAASRGFVYTETAAEKKYHKHCHCTPVVEWEPEGSPLLKAYDPGKYRAMYDAALKAGAGTDIKSVTATMRRLYPTALNDGVHTH
jgi:hypothetical protein